MSLSPSPWFQFNWNSIPASGYKLFTYAYNSTTKLVTYTDSALAVPNTNPIILDTQGICTIYILEGTNYKFVLAGPNDTDPPATPLMTTNGLEIGAALATGLNDQFGVLAVTAANGIVNAVNYLNIIDAATGGSIIISSKSTTDTNPALTIQTQGTGLLTLGYSGAATSIVGSTVTIAGIGYPGAVGATGTILQSNGTNNVYTTATYPTTTTVNQILYSSSTNVVGAISTANNGTLVTSNSGVPSILAGSGTTGTILRANAAAAPSWSSATYPASTTINQILYSSSANVVGGITTGNNGVLITDSGGIPSISSTLPSAVQANITTVGTVTTGTWSGTVIALNKGGTNASLTANNGGIVYSTASALAILSGTSTANQIVLSGASTTPAWSTTTWPATTTASNLLYSNGANTIAGLATANSGVLITSATGVPSISTTIPQTTQNNLTAKDLVSYTYFGGL